MVVKNYVSYLNTELPGFSGEYRDENAGDLSSPWLYAGYSRDEKENSGIGINGYPNSR